MDENMEAKAVQILEKRLEAEGGSAPVTSLSVKVKWGQHELQGFGHIRKFLSKHDKVFALEGSSVVLVPKKPPGPPGVSPAPSKRAWGEDTVPSKVPRTEPKASFKATLVATPKIKGKSAEAQGEELQGKVDKEPSMEKAKAPWHAQRAPRAPRQDLLTTMRTPCWEEDTLSEEDLRIAIASTKRRGMELELEELVKSLLPTEEYRKTCQRTVLLLKSAFQDFCKRTSLQGRMDMVGSAVQNTHLQGSDLDVACFIPGTPEERDLKMANFWDQISENASTNFEAMDATRHFPHACGHFSVKLRGVPSYAPVACHVLGSGPQFGELDAMLRQLCDCFSLSRDLIRMVKFWATNHGLCGREGYMNGAAWTAFVLCFLQGRQHVPPVSQLHNHIHQKHSETLTELLRGFFHFVCEPHSPRRLSLEGNSPTSHVGGPPLYIEDPVCREGLPSNLASTVGESQWSRILEESRKIVDRLKRLDPGRSQRWFYWAEVFDPHALTGTKGLPKLSECLEMPAETPNGTSVEPKAGPQGPKGETAPGKEPGPKGKAKGS